MKRLIIPATFLVIMAAGTFGNSVQAQVDAPMVFQTLADEAYERSYRRLRGVDYLVKRMESNMMPVTSMPGAGPCALGVCVAFKNEGGVLRILTLTEVQLIAGLAPDSVEMTAMGIGLHYGQDQFNDAMETEMAAASPELGMLAGVLTGDIVGVGLEMAPWANPFQMLSLGGDFMLAGAQALDGAANDIARGAEVAQAQDEARRELMQRGRYVGVVDHNGTPAHEFVVEDINQVVEVEGGNRFTMVDTTLRFDANELVMLMHRTDGIARQGGKDMPFYIEAESRDYRHVPGSELYEPYETVSRMGGMLDEKQMAEMAEAKVQLDEFEKQMADMPPDQRAMVEKMMGGQMETMRSLVNTGAFETTQRVLEIYVNPDLAELYAANSEAAAAATGPRQTGGGNLVARIQADLTTLGYDPGEVNGELNTPTVIAISQYQTEKGIEVTGEATESLASVLADELGR